MKLQQPKGTLLIVSSAHWHVTWQRHHQIATHFANLGYEIIYVEPFPKRWPGITEWKRVLARLTGDKEKAGHCKQTVPDGIKIISPFLFPETGSFFEWVNRRFFIPRFYQQLKQVFSPKPLIVLHYLPSTAACELTELLRPQVIVYDSVCEWQYEPNCENAAQKEPKMMRLANIVWADSIRNFERLRNDHSRIFHLAGGVDSEHFSKAASVHTKKQPVRCAYFGDIRANLDMGLLAKVSHAFHLRLIGPSRIPLIGFSKQAEIIGPMPFEKIPDQLKDIDVLLLPYRIMEQNKAVLPAKTFECLATGKPIVAYGLPSLRQYEDVIYLCETYEQFLDKIKQTETEPLDMVQKRFSIAREHSWPQMISQMEKTIQDFIRERTVSER